MDNNYYKLFLKIIRCLLVKILKVLDLKISILFSYIIEPVKIKINYFKSFFILDT